MSKPVTITRLVWDDWNRSHLVKHAVTPEEAEEVVFGRTMIRASYKNRLALTGPSFAGRMLTVVIGEVPADPGNYYVFSARPASRDERRAYRHQVEGGS